jgi:hypothetical protein
LLAGLVMLTTAVPVQSGPASNSINIASFAPPEGPVMLSRTLIRSLIDGREVRTIRHYLIRFSPEQDGWRIEGELREVSVEAPPALERFARLERSRTEPGLFPMLLDSAGRLKPPVAPPADDGSRVKAAAVGDRMIAEALTSPSARKEANAWLARVIMADNGGTAWPGDLFHPERPQTTETREIALPDGSRAAITVVMRSDGLTANTLPARFERAVTTELAGTRRTAREIWEFSSTAP